MKKLLSLFAPIVFGFLSYYLMQQHFEWAPSATAGLAIGIILAWILESIPLAMTALLVPCLASIISIAPIKQAFSAFGHPLIYLFLGGFVIAKGMSVTGLDKRIALKVLTAPGIKGKAWPTLLALIFITAFFSMWISNTAATAMMLPIAAGILNTIFPNDRKAHSVTLIAIAYASSIGGVASPIGSTPNILALGLIRELLPTVEISFFHWMAVSMPITIILLSLLIIRVKANIKTMPEAFEVNSLNKKLHELGPLKRAEKNSLCSVMIAVLIWILPSLLSIASNLWPILKPISTELKQRFPEAVGALLGAAVLFILPSAKSKSTISWAQAVDIDWGSLMLFGGGLSLGTLIFTSGLGNIVGNTFVESMGSSGFFPFLISVVLISILFTETTSNTATASLFIPLVLSAALKADLPAIASVIGVAWACSLAFMLPVATPPNAIVYGSGKIKLNEMIRLGFYMNIGAAITIAGYLYFIESMNWLPQQ